MGVDARIRMWCVISGATHNLKEVYISWPVAHMCKQFIVFYVRMDGLRASD